MCLEYILCNLAWSYPHPPLTVCDINLHCFHAHPPPPPIMLSHWPSLCSVSAGCGRTDQKALSHSFVSGAVGAESPEFLDHNVRGKDREGGWWVSLERKTWEQAEEDVKEPSIHTMYTQNRKEKSVKKSTCNPVQILLILRPFEHPDCDIFPFQCGRERFTTDSRARETESKC